MRARRREGCEAEGEEHMEQTLRRHVGEDVDAVELIERVDKARDIFDQPGDLPSSLTLALNISHYQLASSRAENIGVTVILSGNLLISLALNCQKLAQGRTIRAATTAALLPQQLTL